MDRYSGFDKMPIAGTWREGRSKRHREDRNPYNDEVLVTMKLADASDIDEAYRVAEDKHREQAQGGDRRLADS